MTDGAHQHLSRRERQIMDIVYREGRVSAADVLRLLPGPPSYSAVRAMLRVLENKGHLRHEAERTKYVYLPTLSRVKARRSALENLIKTFFDDSAEKAVAALIDNKIAGIDITDQRKEVPIAQFGDHGQVIGITVIFFRIFNV